jgi:predicted nucleic acid-binding protein
VPVVVADAGPLHYLVLIGETDFFPLLFRTVLVPETVRDELSRARTPPAVRAWIANAPAWIKIVPTPPLETLPLPELGAGERAAIALAMSRRADLILVDDRRAAAAALDYGLVSIGTIGLLDRAAQRRLIDLATAVTRLKATNFRYRQELLDALLARHQDGNPGHA